MVEYSAFNRFVPGSSPGRPTKTINKQKYLIANLKKDCRKYTAPFLMAARIITPRFQPRLEVCQVDYSQNLSPLIPTPTLLKLGTLANFTQRLKDKFNIDRQNLQFVLRLS